MPESSGSGGKHATFAEEAPAPIEGQAGEEPTNRDDTAEEEQQQPLPEADPAATCLICKKDGNAIAYAAWPCGCPSMCKLCAQVSG